MVVTACQLPLVRVHIWVLTMKPAPKMGGLLICWPFRATSSQGQGCFHPPCLRKGKWNSGFESGRPMFPWQLCLFQAWTHRRHWPLWACLFIFKMHIILPTTGLYELHECILNVSGLRSQTISGSCYCYGNDHCYNYYYENMQRAKNAQMEVVELIWGKYERGKNNGLWKLSLYIMENGFGGKNQDFIYILRLWQLLSWGGKSKGKSFRMPPVLTVVAQ